MLQELSTFRDLRNVLLQLPIDHPIFEQPIQAVLPTSKRNECQFLLPVTVLGTIWELGFPHTRNSYARGGEHEPEDYVFVLAAHPEALPEAVTQEVGELVASGEFQ